MPASRVRGASAEQRVTGATSQTASEIAESAMNEKRPTYRVEINNNGIAPNKSYGWQIYRNMDVLPILRSQQLFVSRMAGLADANRSRLRLVGTDLQNLQTKEK
jgi:hypothetical protein